MLIFVGWLPPYLYPSRCLPRSRHEDLSQPNNVHEGCAHHRGWFSSTGRCSGFRTMPPLPLHRERLRLRDRPHEGGQFARDGGGHRIGMFAPGEQPAVASTQTNLSPPGDVPNDRGQLLLAGLDRLRDLGAMPIRLGRLDEDPARMAVACLRDPAEPAARATGG